MIWGSKPKLMDGWALGKKVWKKHFCLLPRKVGYRWIWLECIEIQAELYGTAERPYLIYNVGNGEISSASPRRLTEKQCVRLGEKW